MLFWYEFKKLLLAPAVIGFVLLSIAANIAMILTYNNSVSDFDSKPYDVFAEFKTSKLAEMYITQYSMPENDAARIRLKYEQLKSVLDEKSANGDALSSYFRDDTYYKHGLLFGNLMSAILIEASVLALFLALLSVGYENAHHTENVAFSSRKGRKLTRTKLFSSLVAAASLMSLILAISLPIFLSRFDFSGVWGDNVSSSFNYSPILYGIPFMTWHSFTVAGLLWAKITAGIGLCLCFALLGFAIGTFVRNGYVSVIAALAMCALMLMVPQLFHVGSLVRGVLMLTPIKLLTYSPAWFTDGGADILWANFEIVGIIASTLVLAIASMLAIKIFKRKELL